MTMTIMPLVRVPLTLAAAIAFHVSMSPPIATRTAPSPSETGDRHATTRTAARFIAAMLTKGLFWASALTDVLVVLAPYAARTALPAAMMLPIPPEGTQIPLVPTLFIDLPVPSSLPLVRVMLPVTGTILALSGALLRSAAYRALGQFYACPGPGPGGGPCGAARGLGRGRRAHHRHAHALITTGPYARVRHPGYAGLVLCTAGIVVHHIDVVHPGSGVGVGWSLSAGGVSAGMRAVALGCAVLGTVGAVWRIQNEERALRARFGGEWRAWAERVRYRLVPGVY